MLENLYASIKKLNDDLLDKTNAPDYIGANFQDAMDFNITCNALSLIKSIMLGNNRALSSMLNIRNLIECFVLLDMDAAGNISEEQKDLFLEAYKLIEYKSYSKTEQRDLSSVIDFKELEKKYLQAKAKFEKADIAEKKLKNLQKSRLPFLCDAKINCNVLLEKYAHPYLSPYILLSRLVHPNSFRFPLDPQTYDCLATLIIAQLSDLYGNIEHSGVNNFYQEYQLLYAFNLDLPDNHNKKLKDLCESQAKILSEIVEAFFDHYGKNSYTSSFLHELALILLDVNTDSQFGFSENAKLKFKVIIEMMACFNKVCFVSNPKLGEYYYDLLCKYDICKEREFYNKETIEHDWSYLYDAYKAMYPNSLIDIEKFKKAFNKPLGFFIDEKGAVPSFSKLVKEFLAEFCGEAKIEDSDILTQTYLYMLYQESQNMSHGCGYLFFANTGAWKDDSNVIKFLDSSIIFILTKFDIWFSTYSICDETKLKIADLFKKKRPLYER